MTRSETRRPAAVTVLVGVLGFLGVTALGGGVEMVLFANGNEYLPIDLMEGVPVLETFLVPGLVLGGIFGVGSLVAAVGIIRRTRVSWLAGVEERTGRHWSWALTVLLGIAFAAWMLVEWVWLGTPWASETASEATVTWVLYGVYDTVAIILLVLPHLSSVQRFLACHVDREAAGSTPTARSTSMVGAGTGPRDPGPPKGA